MTNDLKRYQEEEVELMRKISALTEQIETIPKQILAVNTKRERGEREVERLRGLQALDDTDLYDATLNKKLIDGLTAGDPDAERHRSRRYSDGKAMLWVKDRRRVKEKRMELHAMIQQLEKACNATVEMIASLEADREGLTARIHIHAEQLRDIRNAKDRLYRTIKGISSQLASPAPVRTHLARQSDKKVGTTTMTAEDLRHTTFETFELPTELGRFLGKLDRNKTAFVLTGDSGAGKSHFAFELTRLFSDEGYRTKYFCLEEGFGALTQQKIHTYDISDDVVFVDQATLADVRSDAAKYDVIVLDSFSKLDVGAEEFERLRTDFPRTIFIIIFQKTTTGGIRGGSSILFNSSATIDVRRDGDDRVAHMVKGRYGTQGWRYSISDRMTVPHE